MATLNEVMPRTYAQSHHSIIVNCGMTLTPGTIRARLAALNDPNDAATQRFIDTYGAAHLRAVIAWFQQALADIDTY